MQPLSAIRWWQMPERQPQRRSASSCRVVDRPCFGGGWSQCPAVAWRRGARRWWRRWCRRTCSWTPGSSGHCLVRGIRARRSVSSAWGCNGRRRMAVANCRERCNSPALTLGPAGTLLLAWSEDHRGSQSDAPRLSRRWSVGEGGYGPGFDAGVLALHNLPHRVLIYGHTFGVRVGLYPGEHPGDEFLQRRNRIVR